LEKERKKPLDLTSLLDPMALKASFIAEYGGFADRRITKIEKGHIFIVDDRGRGDFAANGNPYSYFCAIMVDVISDDLIEVSLSGNVPRGPTVTAWIARHKPTSETPFLEFNVAKGEQKILADLASAMRAIVRRGAPRYDTPSYKYVCPRTAYSLDRLKSVLDRAWPPDDK